MGDFDVEIFLFIASEVLERVEDELELTLIVVEPPRTKAVEAKEESNQNYSVPRLTYLG